MNKEKIQIWWEGPFSIEEIQSKKIDSIGLYQIYGSHPLYGDGVLVYIGKTINKFYVRLKKRWVIEKSRDKEHVEIYLGTIFSDRNTISYEEKIKQIEKAEILLINALKPAFNSSNIQSVKNITDEYTIYNSGNYRNLYPILETNYFWQSYKNYTFINEIALELEISINEDEIYYGFELDKNDKFNIQSNYKIWLCVDYAIWDRKEVPLTLQIASENKKIIDTVKNIGFYKFTYDDEEIGEVMYKSIDAESNITDIINEIIDIIDIVNKVA